MTTSGVIDTGVPRLTLRFADITDAAAVAAMHQRCSPASRYRRYLSGHSTPSYRHLRNLVAPPAGYAVVAETADGAVIALGNLMWCATTADAEVALLVEDAWQRRGVGTALLRRLAGLAGQIGIRDLYLHTHADNVGLIRVAGTLGVPVARHYADGVLTLQAVLQEPCLLRATDR